MSDFTFSVLDNTVFGDIRVKFGTFYSSGVTGGPINTGFRRVNYFSVTPILRSGVVVSGISISGINAMFPISGGTVEIMANQTNVSGIWMAYGRA